MAEPARQNNTSSDPLREKFVRKDQLSVAEYKALREKETKKEEKRFKLPTPVKMILALPFILIALFGLFFIPYICIQCFSSPAKTTTSK